MKLLHWLSSLFAQDYATRRLPRMRRRLPYLSLIEQLELRALLTMTWTGGGDGVNWIDSLNWAEQTVPGAGDDVVVRGARTDPNGLMVNSADLHGTSLIGSDGDHTDLTVREGISGSWFIESTATVEVQAGEIPGNVTVNGTLIGGKLTGLTTARGTLEGVTISGMAGANAGATLIDCTIEGTGQVRAGALTSDLNFISIVGSLHFEGTYAEFGIYPQLKFAGSNINIDGAVHITGQPNIDLNGGGRIAGTQGGELIVDPGVQLFIDNGGWVGYGDQPLTIVNQGTITARVTLADGFVPLSIGGGNAPQTTHIENHGLINTDSSTLIFMDNSVVVNRGTIQPNNHPDDFRMGLEGMIDFRGEVTNTLTGLIQANVGTIYIQDRTINDGVIEARGGHIGFGWDGRIAAVISGSGRLLTSNVSTGPQGTLDLLGVFFANGWITNNTVSGTFVGGRYDNVTVQGQLDIRIGDPYEPRRAAVAWLFNTLTLDDANVVLHGIHLSANGNTSFAGRGTIHMQHGYYIDDNDPQTITEEVETRITILPLPFQSDRSLTIGENIVVRGTGFIGNSLDGLTFVHNLGQILPQSGPLLVSANLINDGLIEPQVDGSVSLPALDANNGVINLAVPTTLLTVVGGGANPLETGVFRMVEGTTSFNRNLYINDGDSRLEVRNESVLKLQKDLLGSITDPSRFIVQSTLEFNRDWFTIGEQQLLEAMGIQQIDGVAEEFHSTFVIHNLSLSNRARVKLVDFSDNNLATRLHDAVYVDNLSVPFGTQLDLNGLHLYVKNASIGGQIINGTLTPAAPPTVTAQPSSTQAQPHQSATFFAAAALFDSVQWYGNTGPGTSFAPISGATSTTLVLADVRVAMDGRQYYAIFSNVAGSTATNTVSLTVLQPSGPPAAPANLQLQAIDQTHVRLTWIDQADNEDAYFVERSFNASDWTPIAILEANSTSYQDTSVVEDTTYYYRVRAHNLYQDDSYSAFIQAGPLQTPQSPPAANAYRDAILASQPAGYWRLGEGSVANNTVAVDASGNGLNGRYFVAAPNRLIAGVTGAPQSETDTGVTFAGIPGSGAAVVLPQQPFGFPSAGGGDFVTTHTFEIWFKTQSSGVIIGQVGTAAPMTNPEQSVNGFVPVVYVDSLGYVRGESLWNGTGRHAISDKPYNDGAYHHMVLTDSGNGLTLYIDGKVVGGVDVGGPSAFNANYTYFLGTGIAIGRPNAPQSGFNYFNGTLDEAAVYQYVLSPSTILQHYNAGRGLDYGDAAASYGPARHVATGPVLGFARDYDLGPYDTSDTHGDDSSYTDDEDGILVLPTLVPGDTATLHIDVENLLANTTAYLSAWVDLDANGLFDSTEAVALARPIVGSGIKDVDIAIPAGLNTAISSRTLRVRVSSAPVLSPNDGNAFKTVLNVSDRGPDVVKLTPSVDFGEGTEANPGNGAVLDRNGTSGNLFGGIGVNLGIATNIAATWSGKIMVPEDADYSFTLRSDDGSVLYIDGNLVVDNNFFQGPTNRSGVIHLSAGLHEILIGGFQGGGGVAFQASWQQLNGASPFARRIIESSALYNDLQTSGFFNSGGLRGDYYRNYRFGVTPNVLFPKVISSPAAYLDGEVEDYTLSISESGPARSRTLTAQLNGGDLLIEDATSEGKQNSMKLSVVGSDLVISDLLEGFMTVPDEALLDENYRTMTIPLSLVTGTLIIRGGGGDDTVNISTIGAQFSANLNIDGQAGTDTVRLKSYLPFAPDRSLSITAESTDATNAHVMTTGTGTISIASDRMAIDAISTLSSEATIAIHPQTAGLAVTIGSEVTTTLALTDAELDRLSASTILLGNSQTGTVTVTAPIQHSGDDSFEVESGRNIVFQSGSGWTTAGGNLTFTANDGADASGNFIGIDINHANVSTSGTGDISFDGRGGNIGDDNIGLFIQNGSVISSTGVGELSFEGTGGPALANNRGIQLDGAGTLVSSTAGAIDFYGQGGFGLYHWNIGFWQVRSAAIQATGSASVTIEGHAGTGNWDNNGVLFGGFGNAGAPQITVENGNLNIEGFGSPSSTEGWQRGIGLFSGTQLRSAGTGKISLDGTGGVGRHDGRGIEVGETSSIVSAVGDISLKGQGGPNIYGFGIWIQGESYVESTGMAKIFMDGTGGVGPNAEGVALYGTSSRVSSVDGDISIIGRGGDSTETGKFSHGISLHNGPQILSTGDAKIILNGTGDSTSRGTDARGVEIGDQGSLVKSVRSDIEITARGGNGAIGFGMSMYAGGAIETGASGNITIHATGGDAHDGNGFIMFGYEGRTTHISSVDGDISITGHGGTQTTNGFWTRGVALFNGTVQSTGAGDITIDGTGGDAWREARAVELIDASVVRVKDGDIHITGHSGVTFDTAYTYNFGVFIRNSTVESTGTVAGVGNIVIEGIGGSGSGADVGVGITNSSIIRTAVGNIEITGQGADGHGGNNYGISVESSSSIASNSTGEITLRGTGGDGTNYGIGVLVFADASIVSQDGNITVVGHAGSGGAFNIGVDVEQRGKVESLGTAKIDIDGTGGAGTNGNWGVNVFGANAVVRSADGDITITGHGGQASGLYNTGVHLQAGGAIEATSAAKVTVTGTGGTGGHHVEYHSGQIGVWVIDAESHITAKHGDISITGTGGDTTGQGGSDGVRLQGGIVGTILNGSGDVAVTGAAGTGNNSFGITVESDTASTGLNTSAGTGSITLISDSINIDTSVHPGKIEAGQGSVAIRPSSAGLSIDLGGDDGAGILGITNAELDRIFADALVIGNATSGPVNVIDSLELSSNLHLIGGEGVLLQAGPLIINGGVLSIESGLAGVSPVFGGRDIIASATTLSGTLAVSVTGPAANAGYSVLAVEGTIDLSSVMLSIAGTYIPTVGDSLTLVDNDLDDPILGTFLGLTEGDTVNVNGTLMTISYAGGSGNDVVLSTVVNSNQSPTVSLTNVISMLPEYTYTIEPVVVADIVVADDALGMNSLFLTGPDAVFFEISGNRLILKSGAILDFESKPNYDVTVNVDDPTVGSVPDSAVAYTLALTDVVESASPVIGRFDLPITYVENAVGLALGINATVSDPDSTQFMGGQLIVSVIAGAESADQISVRNVGILPNQVGVSGNTITFGGNPIATVAGGIGSTPMVITFINTSATKAAAQAVLRNVLYRNVSDEPSTLVRTVQVQMADGLGGVSSPVSKSITVIPVNDKPVLGGFAGNTDYTENDPPVVLAVGATVIDVDSHDLESGELTVRVLANVHAGDRISVRHVGTNAGQIGVSLTDGIVSYGGVAIGTFTGTTALTVTLTSDATPEAVQALLRNITFQNISDAPSTGPRTISATLTDGDGGISATVVTTVQVAVVNDIPVIGAFDLPVTYRENSAPILIDGNAIVTDPDLVNFDGGVLAVELISNRSADDRLTIRNQGLASGQIGVAGNQLTFGVLVGGVLTNPLIATFSGGPSGNDPLIITFNSAATAKAVQAVLRNVTFRNLSEDPSALARTVQVHLTDGDGGTSLPATKTISVTPVNDKPVLHNFAGDAAYTENEPPVILAADAAVVDVDSHDLESGKLTVRVTTNIHAGDRISIRNGGTDPGQIGVNLVDGIVSYGGVAIGTFNGTTALTVDFTNAATPEAVQALLGNITFHNVSEAPSTSPRTVSATLTDGDGGTSTTVFTTVQVTAVNDNPVIGAFDLPVTYRENAAPVLIDLNATVTDPDLVNFEGGVLTVALIANGSADDRLTVRNQGLAAGQVGVVDNQLTFGVLVSGVLTNPVVATFTGGTSGSDPLVITFNSAAMASAVQAVLRNAAFHTVSEDASSLLRTVQVGLTDGDGGASDLWVKAINVTPVKDAPTIASFSGSVSYHVGGPAVQIDAEVTVDDLDTPYFDLGTLKVALTTNKRATDVLEVASVGDGIDEIRVSASQVYYEGKLIGTFSGLNTLTFTLNVNASHAAVQKLLRSITFRSTAASPSLATRTITVSLADGTGVTSTLQSKSIEIISDA